MADADLKGWKVFHDRPSHITSGLSDCRADKVAQGQLNIPSVSLFLSLTLISRSGVKLLSNFYPPPRWQDSTETHHYHWNKHVCCPELRPSKKMWSRASFFGSHARSPPWAFSPNWEFHILKYIPDLHRECLAGGFAAFFLFGRFVTFFTFLMARLWGEREFHSVVHRLIKTRYCGSVFRGKTFHDTHGLRWSNAWIDISVFTHLGKYFSVYPPRLCISSRKCLYSSCWHCGHARLIMIKP